jgi:hypothetical protein
MTKVVKHKHPEEQYDLVNGLLQLFAEIDINDDKNMEFDEFATYLIEAVEARKLSAKELKEQIRDKSLLTEDESYFPEYMRFSDLLHKAMSEKVPVFEPSQMLRDGKSLSRTNAVISRILLYPPLDAIVICEFRQRKIKIVSAQSNAGLIGKPAEVTPLQELHLPNSSTDQFILDCAVDVEQHTIAFTSTEGLIYFWGHFSSQKTFKLFRVVCCHELGPMIGIWHLAKHKVWISATGGPKEKNKSLFNLYEWSVPTTRESVDRANACRTCE